MNHGTCKLCGNSVDINNIGFDQTNINCSLCKKYVFEESLNTDIDIYEDRKNEFYKVSSYIYEQNTQFNNIPKIDKQKLEEVLDMKGKKIKEKFDLMMNYLSNINLNTQLDNNILVQCWIKDTNELDLLIEKASNNELVSISDYKTMGGYSYPFFSKLTFDGIEYVESLEKVNQNSKNIFVAFNFEDNLKEIFNTHLKTAIEKEGFNYVVVNQNNVEYNKSINDEIIVKLKSSRIVIADFTNHRNSVYFEAGYAMGMNIPIIWACHKKHENEMSFDTRQFPHIIWKDEKDLVKQVIDRIKVIL